jgi:hypothetical protein
MKIIIEVEGGLVQRVLANRKDAQAMIVDRDVEGADPDEILTQKEINDYIRGNKFYDIDTTGGITDLRLDLKEERGLL